MIQLFLKLKLVALFLASLPSSYSPFSPCERRMAPLSKELNGIVLDHQHYGSQMNSLGETSDMKLERKNFKHAGETLASVFNNVYDGHKTLAQTCIHQQIERFQSFAICNADVPIETSDEWISNHI